MRLLVVLSLLGWALVSPVPADTSPEISLSNRLGSSPLVVDRLYVMADGEAFSGGELERVIVKEGPDGAMVVLADERENRFPRRGRYTSPEIVADFPFTELLPSWNVDTPPETGINFHVRVRDMESGLWSPWLYVGQWGRTLHWVQRTVEFELGRINVDYLILGKPADAFQLRADFYSYDIDTDANPALLAYYASYSGEIADPEKREALRQPALLDGDWSKSLPVPFLSQIDLDRAVSGSTCSPTSVNMVMGYHGVYKDLRETALAIYDREYGIFGNWTRAVAFPSDEGLRGHVRRFRNWDQVKAKIADGQPVIASIRFGEGEFPSNPMKSTNGHLVVVRGFTEDGDVIVNDPAHREEGNGIVYKADELARAWFDKGGVAYVITSAPEQ